ncbi:MAG TPA: hypothetical protein VK280_00565 [Streptosporangiaceae bacterium]|nr:hypothetical protein [Streptosporangiaceae bacterium]
MFISTESRLDIGFSAAQDKLADLASDGLLGRISGDAYDQWQAGLVRAGPRGTMLGMYRIVRVRVTGMVTHGNSALWAMRWEVAGRCGALVPALDADIKLTPAGPDATVLTVSGVCRPPLARLAAGHDPPVTRQVAQAAIQVLTSHIAASIADPAAGPGAEHGTMRPGPGAEYGTMRPSPGAEHGTMRPGPGAEHSTMRPGPAPEAAYRDRTAS